MDSGAKGETHRCWPMLLQCLIPVLNPQVRDGIVMQEWDCLALQPTFALHPPCSVYQGCSKETALSSSCWPSQAKGSEKALVPLAPPAWLHLLSTIRLAEEKVCHIDPQLLQAGRAVGSNQHEISMCVAVGSSWCGLLTYVAVGDGIKRLQAHMFDQVKVASYQVSVTWK